MPNNKPMRKKKGGNKKPLSKVERRARRSVNVSFKPVRRQIKRDARQDIRGVENAYGGYEKRLGEIPEFDTTGLQEGLTANLQGLAGFLPGYTPPGETAATQGLMGATGATGFNDLASMEAREGMYSSSAQREAGLAERTALGNIISGRREDLSDIRMQLPALYREREDELRQQALENRLARSSIKSDEAFRQYLMDQIGATLKTDRRRRRRRKNADRSKQER